ncbi:MAG: toprim domain-containing protein [Methylococcaceae bacterium]
MDRSDTTPAGNRGSKYGIQQGHYTNVVDRFKTAMLDAGITPPDNIIGDGQLHRFKIDGKLNGAYVLHLDGRAAGYFQDFRQGIKQNWKQACKFVPFSEFQRQALKAQCQREQAERQAEITAKHKEAESKAVYIWNNAKPVPANHPYLIKKRIGTHGARLVRDNTLIIPLYNASRELVNLQFISETGGKRFLSGGKKKGCFFCLGDPTKRIPICEGFATGASIYENAGHLTVIAFDAGNLKEVAIVIKSLYPSAEIIIAGDNDESGVGQKAAREAALAIRGKYIIPPIVGMDFNDYLNMEVQHES